MRICYLVQSDFCADHADNIDASFPLSQNVIEVDPLLPCGILDADIY